MSRSTPRLKLTFRTFEGREMFEYIRQPLRHPEDVRFNRRRDRHDRLVVETDEQAEEYGRSLIDAFNAKAGDHPRTFLSCTLERPGSGSSGSSGWRKHRAGSYELIAGAAVATVRRVGAGRWFLEVAAPNGRVLMNQTGSSQVCRTLKHARAEAQRVIEESGLGRWRCIVPWEVYRLGPKPDTHLEAAVFRRANQWCVGIEDGGINCGSRVEEFSSFEMAAILGAKRLQADDAADGI